MRHTVAVANAGSGVYPAAPFDPPNAVYSAVEEALRLVAKHPGEVVVVSIGGKEVHEQLRHALAMGATGCALSTTIVRLIRDMRRDRGERQEDMARALGISRPQLANAERQRFGLGREPAARLKMWIAGETTE